MSRHVFPSISGRKVAYTYHVSSTALWDVAYRTNNGPLSPQMGEFATYGDGQTQHEPESAVRIANAADYFASLADYLLGLSPEAAKELGGLCDSDKGTEAARFALSIKHQPEGKTRYYNLSERKVSSSPSRRHDRRWLEVKSWVDGSVTSACHILEGEERQPWIFDQWRLRAHVLRVALEDGAGWSSCGRHLFTENLFPHLSPSRRQDEAERADRAWDALYNVSRSLRLRSDAAWEVQSYKRRLAQEEAEAASQAAEKKTETAAQ